MYSEKGVCHFFLVIYSYLGPISHRFRDMADFSLNFLPLSRPFNPKFENVSLVLHC